MSNEAPKSSQSLIHIDGAALAEPARLLVERACDAVGGWLRPWQMRRIGAAEADVKRLSKRVVSILAEMNKADASLFQTLCRFCWNRDGRSLPVITNWKHAIYATHGVDWQALTHLSDMRLVFLDWIQGVWAETIVDPNNRNSQIPVRLSYAGTTYAIRPSVMNGLRAGNAAFSKAGEELASVCAAVTPVPEFAEHCVNFWRGENATIEIVSP